MNGDCFKCAHEALLANDHKWQNARMVHTDVTHSKTGEPYPHAYVVYEKPLEFPGEHPPEWGGNTPMMEFVHDQSNNFKGNQDTPRIMYEMNARPNYETMREYNLNQAVEEATGSGHYGPWGGSVQKSAFDTAWALVKSRGD
tara:strand:- start:943 stop:1368 length:426 start_codon:yes stop_codon:yes gene_type:complete